MMALVLADMVLLGMGSRMDQLRRLYPVRDTQSKSTGARL